MERTSAKGHPQKLLRTELRRPAGRSNQEMQLPESQNLGRFLTLSGFWSWSYKPGRLGQKSNQLIKLTSVQGALVCNPGGYSFGFFSAWGVSMAVLTEIQAANAVKVRDRN